MQTLTPTVFPCYAPADRETAAAIAALLASVGDARVFLDEGELRPGEDLAAKAREARMAEVALVLFSVPMTAVGSPANPARVCEQVPPQ